MHKINRSKQKKIVEKTINQRKMRKKIEDDGLEDMERATIEKTLFQMCKRLSAHEI